MPPSTEYVHLETFGSSEALRSATSSSSVSSRLPWISVSLPLGLDETNVHVLPPSVIVSPLLGFSAKTIVPSAFEAPSVVGLPKAAFSQMPQAMASIGTTISPSVVTASLMGGRGSRP